MQTRQEQESPLDSLVDDITTKIWVENLKPQDRLAFASTSKKYLSLFKPKITTASVHDLLIQLNRIGITQFTVNHFTGVPNHIIAQLIHALSEDFRNIMDRTHLYWLTNDSLRIVNPAFWQLILTKILFDLGLTELPARFYQPFLSKDDLPACINFIKIFSKIREHMLFGLPLTKGFYQLLREAAVFPSLQEVCEFLEEKMRKIEAAGNVRDLKLPGYFLPHCLQKFVDMLETRNLVSDNLATYITQMLAACSEQQLKFVCESIDEDFRQGTSRFEIIVETARFLRIFFPLAAVLDNLISEDDFKLELMYKHFFKCGYTISALQQQSIIHTTIPLLQKLKLEHADLADVIFIATGIYCLHAKRFSHRNHTIKQFICAMSALKNENARLYAYFVNEFQKCFDASIGIGSVTITLYIEQLTPYLIQGTAQRVLDKYYDSLSQMTVYCKQYGLDYSILDLFLQCLEKLDSALLTEGELEKLIVDVPHCESPGLVVQKFKEDRCQPPRVSM